MFSGYTREISDRELSPIGADPPAWATLTRKTLPSIRQRLPRTVSERAEKLLIAIHARTSYFGDQVRLNLGTDRTLGYAANQEEFRALIRLLKQREFLEDFKVDGTMNVTLSAKGVDEVDRLRRGTTDSATGFVAMSFDPSLTTWFETVVSPAIERAGYRPLRMDFHEHNEQIVDKMLAEIRAARFVVADFSQHRHGVYFEAGFAMGLGRPVIWLVREQDVSDCHFDTRQYPHLVWKDGDDLEERLFNRIRATIGQGPLQGSAG
ncbi:MAG: nucleoside 2-deoxyribosyltransferase [Planctomycetaceae bacterium]|nr:nucleoside 2-deoxyribosyltransferase [Planctomycetaceae bacterium]